MKPHENVDALVVAGKAYASRLLVGTGKYKDFAETRSAIEASGITATHPISSSCFAMIGSSDV